MIVRWSIVSTVASAAAVACLSCLAEWQVVQPVDGVVELRNESGAWGGFSMGVSHINHAKYQARKTLDLTALPPGALQRAKHARLRFYFAIQDYSWAGGGKHNGLNESFEILINGNVLTFRTSDPCFPAKDSATAPLDADWVDIDIPLDWLRGEDSATVIFRKPKADTADDYIYPGIDNSAANTNSAVSFDGGETWETKRLNTIGAQGEYMVRLLLVEKDLRARATWRPPAPPEDLSGLIAYAGRDDGSFRVEPEISAYDGGRTLRATVRFRGTQPVVTWMGLDGKALPADTELWEEAISLSLPPGKWEIDALTVTPLTDTVVSAVELDFHRPAVPRRKRIDICPPIAPAKGKRRRMAPTCQIVGDTEILDNGAIRAVFRIRPHLELLSLQVAELDRNVLAEPARTHLFRLKIGDAVYGCRDGRVIDLNTDPTGFTATLDMVDTGMHCVLRASAEGTELRLGLDVINSGSEAVQFYLAFPHLAGLQLSDRPADDYYLFPWGGGVIADVNATLRTAYGENSCWWQMIDTFSPAEGGGLYVRADDATGLYKSPCLRKGESVSGDYGLDETGQGYLRPEMMWRTALDPAPGIGITFDYIRRDRAPGTSFRAPDGCIGSHAGDWREAMRTYAEWSHTTWPPRPYPSKLSTRWHIDPPGWGQHPLFKDGAYRTDYIRPDSDVAEMMSWWTWSDKGPWGTPMDKLEEELGTKLYQRYASYWVKEPVSGKLMYPLNRGDYDGYMPQWGGLPALRKHIQMVKDAGLLAMFYTDPILACVNTKLGSQYGPVYGIMNPDWKDSYECPKTPEGYVGSYGGYCMCLDTEWYSNWVAETMGRVCRETGIDGVRLDEYGHRGYVCRSEKHQHLFAEWGHNGWLQALGRNCRQVHAAMDKVRPDLVLTTEFPGHDYMAAALEGAIVYDIRRIRPVRPTPINLFRFFFPSCKPFEIDRPPRREAPAWMLWNTVGAFARPYPKAQHIMLRENNDVFTSLQAEPLIPTLIRRIYANCFRGGGKTFTTLHNATGHTVDAPILTVRPTEDTHFMDMLRGIELTPTVVNGRTTIALGFKRDVTRVIAQLPRILTLAGGCVDLHGDAEGVELVVADTKGTVLAELSPGAALPVLPDNASPLLVKALRHGLLLDAIPWKR